MRINDNPIIQYEITFMIIIKTNLNLVQVSKFFSLMMMTSFFVQDLEDQVVFFGIKIQKLEKNIFQD